MTELFALLFFLVLYPAHAKTCPSQLWRVQNLMAIKSNGSTVADTINQNPHDIATIQRLISHLEQLESRQLAGDPVTGGYWPCQESHKMKSAVKNVEGSMIHQGFGRLYQCLSVIGDDERDRNQEVHAKDVYTSIKRFSELLLRLPRLFLADYGLQWTHAEPLEVLNYEAPDIYRKCKLFKSLAFRTEGGHWSISALYTNKSVLMYIREGRGTFSEAVGIDRATRMVRSVNFSTPVCKNQILTNFTSGTGMLNLFQGSSSSSHFGFTPLEENPGIQAALRKGNHEKEQVEDSDTISNDALIVLPAILALVPIGLFQDVSLYITIIYIIATDVISVMPLLIKGIELIIYGSKKHYATVSYFYGGQNATDLAVVETWAVECSMRSFVKRKGIVLLCSAFLSISVGIFLEFFTRYLVKRYRSRAISLPPTPCTFHTPDMPLEGPEDSAGLLWHIKRAASMRARERTIVRVEYPYGFS